MDGGIFLDNNSIQYKTLIEQIGKTSSKIVEGYKCPFCEHILEPNIVFGKLHGYFCKMCRRMHKEKDLKEP